MRFLYHLGAIHKGRPADPGEGGLRNPDIQLLFECDSIVLSECSGEGGLEILVLSRRLLWMAPNLVFFIEENSKIQHFQ